MYCFSAIGRAVISACYDPAAHSTQPPVGLKPDPAKMQQLEASPAPPSFPEKINDKPVEEAKVTAKLRQQQEEDALMKELEPTYKAPKRVGAVVLGGKEATKSGRFAMEDHTDSAWDTDL
jgi:hypothetical protein